MTAKVMMSMRVLAWPAFNTRHLNPYNSLLYENLVALGTAVEEYSFRKAVLCRYNVLHLHWPDFQLSKKSTAATVIRLTYLFLLLLVAKVKRAKIVWTVHNLRSHEQFHPFLEAGMWRLLTALIDGYLPLTSSGQTAALARFPLLRKVPSKVVPHGHYKDVYDNNISKPDARAKLGLPADAGVLLFAGNIRPYKNVCHLIETFKAMENSNAYLVVAGNSTDNELASNIAALATGHERIRLMLSHISDQDISTYLSAADLVVLPFTDILNSGSALLALSFNKPILVPLKGAMHDLRDHVGDDWVYTYEDKLSDHILQNSLERARRSGERAANLEALDWAGIARQTRDFFLTL